MKPPIPSPAPQSCANCGLPIDPPLPFCPQCGAAIVASSRRLSLARLLSGIFLALAGSLLGIFGAGTMVGGLMTQGLNWSSILAAGLTGLGLLSVGAACLWGLIRLLK